ncbi:MAG: hypothetical protein HZB45_27770 [Mycolicibacterium rufum]|nr:hypothetical protein [Mycolicibacterium rufum]
MTVSAINTFRLRPGVSAADFERFSRDLDRSVCLAFDVVLDFDVYLSDDSPANVVEVMTVTSWPEWEEVRDGAPELRAVVQRFGELVELDSVTTVLTRKSPLKQEI